MTVSRRKCAAQGRRGTGWDGRGGLFTLCKRRQVACAAGSQRAAGWWVAKVSGVPYLRREDPYAVYGLGERALINRRQGLVLCRAEVLRESRQATEACGCE